MNLRCEMQHLAGKQRCKGIKMNGADVTPTAVGLHGCAIVLPSRTAGSSRKNGKIGLEQ